MPITGSCHCGGTAFEIEGEVPERLTRCTCSFCAKRGALHAYFQPHQFKLTTPAGNVMTYRWNSKLVAHNFCPSAAALSFRTVRRFNPTASGMEQPAGTPSMRDCLTVSMPPRHRSP